MRTKRKDGRQRVGMCVTFAPDLARRLDAAVARAGGSRSAFVQEAVIRALVRYERLPFEAAAG